MKAGIKAFKQKVAGHPKIFIIFMILFIIVMILAMTK